MDPFIRIEVSWAGQEVVGASEFRLPALVADLCAAIKRDWPVKLMVKSDDFVPTADHFLVRTSKIVNQTTAQPDIDIVVTCPETHTGKACLVHTLPSLREWLANFLRDYLERHPYVIRTSRELRANLSLAFIPMLTTSISVPYGAAVEQA